MTEFDFGFTAVTEDELTAVRQNAELAQVATAAAQDATKKAETMYKMIVPLLDNLAKDPQKDYIYWPNRQDKIKQFKAQLLKVVNPEK